MDANTSAGGQRCAGDEDYFKVDAAANQTVIGTLFLEHSDGCDLDLRLETTAGTADTSAGFADREEVTATAASATTYYLRVYSAYSGQSCPYTIDVGVEGP
jgi:hypothetical protein